MKIAVEIVRETKKAKLVRDSAGREAWVQNRSFKNNEVSEAVFSKGVEFLAGRVDAAAEAKAFDESLIPVTVAWESDKAIGVDRTAEFIQASSMYHTKRVRLFFAKGQCVMIDGVWNVKGWQWNAKSAEALEKIQLGQHCPRGYVFAD